MLLGAPMPKPWPAWRFVEDDLYDISRRVQEYDADARVVRHADGRLALARWFKDSMVIAGGRWLLARELFDLTTDLPLAGEPDARVLACQRAYDGWRLDSHHKQLEWQRRSRTADYRREAAEHARIYDESGEPAERMAYGIRREAGRQPSTFIPHEIGDAA